MKAISKATAILVTLGAVLSIPAGGCSDTSDGDLPFAPLDCERQKPHMGYLNIRVTLNARHAQVPVFVYQGDIEDGFVVEQDTVDVATFSYELPTGRKYAVAAFYTEGPDTIMVLDADGIRTKSKEYRDTDCWEVEDGEIDVRLKS